MNILFLSKLPSLTSLPLSGPVNFLQLNNEYFAKQYLHLYTYLYTIITPKEYFGYSLFYINENYPIKHCIHKGIITVGEPSMPSCPILWLFYLLISCIRYLQQVSVCEWCGHEESLCLAESSE